MEFLKYAGAVLTNAVDALADANRRLALTNRLKAIDRAETAKAKATYEALGRYVAEHSNELDMDKVQAMKETAETAEQHAALARRHVESMRHPENLGAIPTENEEQDDVVIADEEEADYAEKEAPAAEAPAEEGEEADEDANDCIPF